MLQGGGSVVAGPTLTHRRLLSEKISNSYEINDEACGFTINHGNNSFSLACQSNEKTLSFLCLSTFFHFTKSECSAKSGRSGNCPFVMSSVAQLQHCCLCTKLLTHRRPLSSPESRSLMCCFYPIPNIEGTRLPVLAGC